MRAFCLLLGLLLQLNLEFAQEWAILSSLTASNKIDSGGFGNFIALSENYALVGAMNSNSAYIFTRSVTQWNQEAILTPNDSVSGSEFGCAVSITYNYALVGAYGTDLYNNQGGGVAYIFSRSGSTWTEQSILMATEGMIYQGFGFSVSLTDEYAIIGATRASPDQITDAGAAWCFSPTSSDWYEDTILTSPNKAEYEYFGTSVSVSEDYALIGAYGSNLDGISGAGIVYVFHTYQGLRYHQYTLTASQNVQNNWFGFSLKLSIKTAIIGLGPSGTQRTYIFSKVGKVNWEEIQFFELKSCFACIDVDGDRAVIHNRLLTRSEETWTQEAIFSITTFSSVAISGDYILVGHDGASPGGTNLAGEAYLFERQIVTTTQSPSPSLSKSNSNSLVPIIPEVLSNSSPLSGRFGHSVMFYQDALVVSRPLCLTPSNCDGGRGFIFLKDLNVEWQTKQVIRGHHRNQISQFGLVMAASLSWLAIVSMSTNYHGLNTAIVHIYSWDPSTNSPIRRAGFRPKSNNQQDMQFGYSVTIIETDAVIGAPGYNYQGMIDAGAFMSYRYRAMGGVWGRNPVVSTAYDAAQGDCFGHSVSLDLSYLAVGNNPASPERQAVYIMTKSGYDFVHFHKIQATNKMAFGWSVLLNNNELAVGAPHDNNLGSAENGGSVTMFFKNSTGHFEEYESIYLQPATTGLGFGYSLARYQNRLLIGANSCSGEGACSLQGKAYLYTMNGQSWNVVRSFSSAIVDGSDYFGTSVAVDANDVAVGAPGTNNEEGSVYTYIA